MAKKCVYGNLWDMYLYGLISAEELENLTCNQPKLWEAK